MKFNIIFPMAGKGSRFGYKFKPFLKISDLTFIQLAFQPFLKYKQYIDKVYFIVTNQQNDEFSVVDSIKNLFPNIDHEVLLLQNDTKGPFETLTNAINNYDIEGSSFICDCDHSININPVIKLLENNENLDILIPTYSLENENINAWSKVYLENTRVIDISEKELLEKSDKVMGIIGCNYFNNLSYFKDTNLEYENISELLKTLIKKETNIVTQEIYRAEFFGDPERLQDCINKRRNRRCVFCDIDGTLIYHKANPNYLKDDTIILDGTIDKLRKWTKENIYLVLTTARSKINEDKLKGLLSELDIYYDDLITGLPSGQRILINDIKPSQPFKEQAKSINCERNNGIKDIDINFNSSSEKIVRVFKGNSFSKTLLIEKDKNLFVRKYIIKNNETMRHYRKLQRQCFDLQRFNCYCNTNICPKILEIVDNSYMFYIDIEYCENYNILNTSQNLNQILKKLFTILKENVYIMKKPLLRDNNWLNNYVTSRLRFNDYKLLDEKIEKLINIDKININGVECQGILKILENQELLDLVKPKYLTSIHGDLTFENIIYNSEKDDIKIIDMDGSDFIDPQELDLGKLFQSLVSRYEIWSQEKDIIYKLDFDNKIIYTKEYTNTEKIEEYKEIIEEWSNILNESYEITKTKAIFYMCTHLIRMIPYIYKVSLEQSLFALKEAILWMNEINID